MKIKAPAKLNLSLNVFPKKRTEGLYPVKFLNYQLILADEIKIQPSDEITVSSLPEVEGENNLVYRAIPLLPQKKGIKINIKKNIPVKAGLAGGSADAAAVLNYLNKAWRLNLSSVQLAAIGQKLGMDVVYCLTGGLCLIEGTGEKVRPLNLSLPQLPILVINPAEQKPSSGWAYQNLDLAKIGRHEEKLTALIQAIKKKNIRQIAANIHNDFEYSVPKAYPAVKQIKKELLRVGALSAMLCGSGLAVFGIYENKKLALMAYNKLKKKFPQIFLTETK